MSIHALPGVPNDAPGNVSPAQAPRIDASTLPPVADLAAWRKRASWRGLPAALPAELVPFARRRGLVVWERAA
jgi:hypothetical protein